MKTAGIKLFVAFLVSIFMADAIDGDILVAELSNTVFHTSWSAITRDVFDGNGKSNVKRSKISISGTLNAAQDDDSPTVLDTAFPNLCDVVPMLDVQSPSTSRGTVHHTYLSLRTLLL